MHIFYEPEIAQNHLSSEESRHAVSVLRLQSGDAIQLTDGKGKICEATITAANPKKSEFKITSSREVPKRNFSIHLAIAPTKNIDRIEWMIEKCVEMGIERISFILCKTSERKVIPSERLDKIVVSALKQSRQAWLPTLDGIIPFQEFMEGHHGKEKFIAYVDPKNPHHLKDLATRESSYSILIGPEGDFTSEEILFAEQKGFQKTSLGPNRLRTETAGLFACGILNFINA